MNLIELYTKSYYYEHAKCKLILHLDPVEHLQTFIQNFMSDFYYYVRNRKDLGPIRAEKYCELLQLSLAKPTVQERFRAFSQTMSSIVNPIVIIIKDCDICINFEEIKSFCNRNLDPRYYYVVYFDELP